MIETLARAGRLYPSLILHGGSRGGRLHESMRLARILLCDLGSEDPEGCDCRHCHRISMTLDDTVPMPAATGPAAFHPDLHILRRDLRTATSVDSTRALLRNAQLSPFEARGQVFVLVEAETLTDGAASALLKILEEPPQSAPRNFILLCPSDDLLLPTIRSRSMSFYIGPRELPDPDATAALAKRFSSCVAEYYDSQSPAFLLAAAQILFESAKWDDPRAAEPWTLVATSLTRAQREGLIPRTLAPGVLALAADLLLLGPQIRVRSVPAQRILDGLVAKNLVGRS